MTSPDLVEQLFGPSPMAIDADTLARNYEPLPPGLRLPRHYCPHVPDTGSPQERFVLDDRKELLYGGAAGGGKSDAILMSALKYIEEPRYAAVIFRKTYADLNKPGALMARSKEWLRGTDAHWNSTDKQWTFPSGATLNFAFLAHSDNKYDHQSAEYQFVGFDELTQFLEDDYLYLFSRLRRLVGSRVPIRMRAASNPGNRGHKWVKERFQITDIGTSTDTPDRAFIPSRLSDMANYIDVRSYREQLSELDDHTRQQLEDGDWNVRLPGSWVLDHQGLDHAFALGARYDEGKVPLPPPVGGALPLGMDYGETSHVLVGWPLEHNGMFIVAEYVYRRGEPDTQAQEFYDRVFSQGRLRPYPMGRQRFDASKPESMRLWVRGLRDLGVLGEHKPSPIAFGKYKRHTMLHMRKMLENGVKGKLGYLAISGECCPVLREQIYEWQYKNDDTEDVKKENDHGPDAAVSLLAPLARKRVS